MAQYQVLSNYNHVLKDKISGDQISERLNSMLESTMAVTLSISEFEHFRNSKLVQAKGKLVSKAISQFCANAEFFKDNQLGKAWYQCIEQNNSKFNEYNVSMTSYHLHDEGIQQKFDNSRRFSRFDQQNSTKRIEQMFQDYQNTIEIQRLVAQHLSQNLEMKRIEVALFHDKVNNELAPLKKKVEQKQFVEEQELEILKQNLVNTKNLNQQVIDKIRSEYEDKFKTEIIKIENKIKELEEIRILLAMQKIIRENNTQQQPYQHSRVQAIPSQPRQPVYQYRPNTANEQASFQNQNSFQHQQNSQQRQINTAYQGQFPNFIKVLSQQNIHQQPQRQAFNIGAYLGQQNANFGQNYCQPVNLNQQFQQNKYQNPPMSNWQALNKKQNENLNTPRKNENGQRLPGFQVHAHNIIQSDKKPTYREKLRQSREQSLQSRQ